MISYSQIKQIFIVARIRSCLKLAEREKFIHVQHPYNYNSSLSGFQILIQAATGFACETDEYTKEYSPKLGKEAGGCL